MSRNVRRGELFTDMLPLVDQSLKVKTSSFFFSPLFFFGFFFFFFFFLSWNGWNYIATVSCTHMPMLKVISFTLSQFFFSSLFSVFMYFLFVSFFFFFFGSLRIDIFTFSFRTCAFHLFISKLWDNVPEQERERESEKVRWNVSKFGLA